MLGKMSVGRLEDDDGGGDEDQDRQHDKGVRPGQGDLNDPHGSDLLAELLVRVSPLSDTKFGIGFHRYFRFVATE